MFDEITLFHRNKHCFVAYDKLFFKKISRDPILPNWFPSGGAYISIVMKKKLARFHF
jgi:hypothetical protein